jgi:hypothetical protein
VTSRRDALAQRLRDSDLYRAMQRPRTTLPTPRRESAYGGAGALPGWPFRALGHGLDTLAALIQVEAADRPCGDRSVSLSPNSEVHPRLEGSVHARRMDPRDRGFRFARTQAGIRQEPTRATCRGVPSFLALLHDSE